MGPTTPAAAEDDETPDEVPASTLAPHEMLERRKRDTAKHREDSLVHHPHHQTWGAHEPAATRWVIAYSDVEVWPLYAEFGE